MTFVPSLPPDLPAPRPTEIDAPFWQACAEQRLRFQHCPGCGHWQHPPLAQCEGCGAGGLHWDEPPGAPELFAWTRVHAMLHPAVQGHAPYLVAVVGWPQAGNLRLLSNLAETPGDAPAVGRALRLVWETVAGGQPVPRFALLDPSRQTQPPQDRPVRLQEPHHAASSPPAPL